MCQLDAEDMTPIEELRPYLTKYHSSAMAVRVLNVLTWMDIEHVEELEGMKRTTLRHRPGFGEASMQTLEMALERFGVNIRPQPTKERLRKQSKRYRDNVELERRYHLTRCLPARFLRVLAESCDGWLDDHRDLMDPEEVEELERAIGSAKFVLSRPIQKSTIDNWAKTREQVRKMMGKS